MRKFKKIEFDMKTSFKVLSSLILLSLLTACNSKPDPKGEAIVDRIRLSPSVSNSELIANPVTADSPVDTKNAPIIVFEKTEYDFGKVKEGEKVEHNFKFTNTGKSPLLIASATGSCGCTVPEFDKSPIAPGKSSEIKVNFNSEGRPGGIEKTVTLIANTIPGKTVIKITGTVEPRPANN